MPAHKALVDYLDPLITETAGTDLFYGPMPETPPACVAISLYDSEPAEDRVMSASLADNGGVWPCRVQVMVRNPDQDTAHARAEAIFALLDNLGPTTLGSVRYFLVEAQGEPAGIGQDNEGLWRVVCDYLVRKGRG